MDWTHTEAKGLAMELDIADVRLKIAVIHYGVEFFHHLRETRTPRQDWPWDFLLEYIDDLEHLEAEARPGVMGHIRAQPLTADESEQGLYVFINRMKHYLGGSVGSMDKKLLLNKFYQEHRALIENGF